MSLRFQNPMVEMQFRLHQFQTYRPELVGGWGVFSMMTVITSTALILNYLEIFFLISKGAEPGTMERALSAAPLTLFNLYYLIQFLRNQKCSQFRAEDCQFFGIGWICLLFLCDVLWAIVYDSFLYSQGCPARRFRCPNAISSSKFSSRAIVISAVTIFNLTPCISLSGVCWLVGLNCAFSRILGRLPNFHSDVYLSVWSMLCVFTQVILFLACRYLREIKERKRFLLQNHIHRLQAKLQTILDQMIPRQMLDRLQPGEALVDYSANAVVFLCSFPLEPTLSLDASENFLLLDRVYQIFDQMVQNEKICMSKVPFVGNDYMLISSHCLSNQSDGKVLHDIPGLVADLNRLALQMSEKAKTYLSNVGIELRFAIATGSAFSAVIGDKNRRFRVFGAAAAEASRLCQLAGPWQVVCSGRDNQDQQAFNRVPRPLDPEMFPEMEQRGAQEVESAALPDGEDFKADGRRWSQVLLNIQTACVSLSQLLFFFGMPGAEISDRFPAESFNSTVPQLCSSNFGVTSNEGVVKALAMSLLVLAAVVPLPGKAKGWRLARRRWARMHAAFFIGLLALAHVRAEAFLFLGFTMACGLFFVAPPDLSAAAARRAVSGAFLAFLAVFCAASARDGLTQPRTNLLLQVALLVYLLPVWLRREERLAALHQQLLERRGEERTALWAALQDLLPEFVLRERFGGGERGREHEHGDRSCLERSSGDDPKGGHGAEARSTGPCSGGGAAAHAGKQGSPLAGRVGASIPSVVQAPQAKPAVVLHAELEGFSALWAGRGLACSGGDITPGGNEEVSGRWAVEDVHELLSLMDREVNPPDSLELWVRING
jgi:class 3 adenylate cyclase